MRFVISLVVCLVVVQAFAEQLDMDSGQMCSAEEKCETDSLDQKIIDEVEEQVAIDSDQVISEKETEVKVDSSRFKAETVHLPDNCEDRVNADNFIVAHVTAKWSDGTLIFDT
jgi:hypothetical protein